MAVGPYLTKELWIMSGIAALRKRRKIKKKRRNKGSKLSKRPYPTTAFS